MLDYGVEIEFIAPPGNTRASVAAKIDAAGVPCYDARYTHTLDRQRWKIVSDGSLTSMNMPGGEGMELVSPPSTEEHFGQIEIISRVLTELGCIVNRTCGLHVHIGARNISVPALKKLAALYVENERIIDQLLPPSRRGNTNAYCGSVASRANLADLSRATNVNGIAAAVHQNNRYVKLNFTAFWKHGTVEFRHHSGTIDGAKITKWILFCSKMVETAVREAHIPFGPTSCGIGDRSYWRKGRRTRTIYELLTRDEGATSEELRVALGVRSRPDVRWHLNRAGAAEVVAGRRGGREIFKLDSVATTPLPEGAPPTRVASLAELCEKLQLAEDDKAFWAQRVAALGTAEAVGANGEIAAPQPAAVDPPADHIF